MTRPMTLLHDALRGSQRPTLLHLPDGVSGAGREAIDLGRECGIVLDDWQEFCVDGLLLERPDHRWAAPEGAVIVTRQNGKNVIEVVIEIAGLVLFDERLITHSAHLFQTATEHFLNMRTMFETVPLLNERLDDIKSAHGFESIILRGGRRLKFFARSRGGGRGFTGDRIVFDEAFSLGADALGAMIPALSARSTEVPGPQIGYFSSPPHSDSAVLHRIIRRAREGDPRLALLGWLNEPDTPRDDIDALYRVNPAMGVRITPEWVLGTELPALDPEEFDRERLGIPSPEDAGATVFGAGKWPACADPGSTIEGGPAIAFDVGPDMQWSSFAAAGRRADGDVHIELIDRRPGTGWVIERAKALAEKWGVPIVLDPRAPAGGLLVDLREAGVDVLELPDGQATKACATLQNGVLNGTVRHLGQAPLDAAVAGAAISVAGDTWKWSRKSASVDITSLVAVTVALWALEQPEDSKPIFAY